MMTSRDQSVESKTGDDRVQTTTALEKGELPHAESPESASLVRSRHITAIPEPHNLLQRWVNRLEQLAGVEARGIERVPEDARPNKMRAIDYIQMFLVWFSVDLTANNLLIGVLGPTAYYVGFKDAMVLGFFGSMLGSAGAAYIATFGARSGCRTLVGARFTMGWWPSRICVLLNIVIMLGYGLVDSLIAGQILSAVNGHGLSVIAGTIVAAFCCMVIVVFGIQVFHIYERYAFIPQILVCFILIGVAGPYFSTADPTTGTSVVQNADRMSFFFLCVSAPLTWAPAAADFFVYFSPSANRWLVFLCTLLGIGLGTAVVLMIGVGVGSGVATNQAWSTAYDGGIGTLLVQCFQPLGRFGDFCCVVLAMGVIANNVPGTYSAALCLSLLGRWFATIPRLVWAIIGTIIYTICACVGRNELYNIFSDFLALMGYWVAIWVVITMEEQFIFRRTRGYDWETWNTQSKQPLGLAALTAFCVGWVGAVLGMYQIYFTGPLASLVGDGIDLGIPLATSWGAITYLPLRWLELKYVGR